MANPFTAFGFPATGTPTPPCSPNSCNRTMPGRIADWKNVKDFGAKGDGVTDDTAAIQKAVNFSEGLTPADKGMIYFPPGNYIVSQTISLDDTPADNLSAIIYGEMAGSVITANFSGYVFSRTQGNANGFVIDGLTIINSNATGGGIRLGGTDGGAIRNCNITANQGISNFNSDTQHPYVGSTEFSIENCILNGSNSSGSQGIMTESNGPITNCRIIGFDYGLLTAGNEGGQNILGCYFEKCLTGLFPGRAPDAGIDHSSGICVAGSWFKNCSTAIHIGAATQGQFLGIYIEGTNGQAPGGNPQYGILVDDSGVGKLNQSLMAGITVVGQYDQAGISISASPTETIIPYSTFAACSSVSWVFGAPSGGQVLYPKFQFCNTTFVNTVAELSGQQPIEGDCFNVSDGTNSLAWGATVTNTGTHTTHYKVRYNGSNFTVVGQ